MVYDQYFVVKASGSDYTNVGFTGQRIDQTLSGLNNGDLEMIYYKNRWYDAETGRFMSHDPLKYIDGMNLYEYIGNSPIMLMDSLGLCQCYPLFGTPNKIKNIKYPYDDLSKYYDANQTQDIVNDFINNHYNTLLNAARESCIPWRAIAALIVNEQSDYGNFRNTNDKYCCSNSTSQGLGQIQPRLACKYKVFGNDFDYYTRRTQYQYMGDGYHAYTVEDWTNTSDKLRNDDDNIKALSQLARTYLDNLCKHKDSGTLGKVYQDRVGSRCLSDSYCCAKDNQDCVSFSNSKPDSCLIKALQGMHDKGVGYSEKDEIEDDYCFDEKAEIFYYGYIKNYTTSMK